MFLRELHGVLCNRAFRVLLSEHNPRNQISREKIIQESFPEYAKNITQGHDNLFLSFVCRI